MKLSLPVAALTALLSTAGPTMAQDHAHSGHSHDDSDHTHQGFVPERDAEFTFKVESNGVERQIPVDCDRLENGELTSEFLHTMGIWGHLDRIEESFLPEAEKIRQMQIHLVLHSQEFIEDIPRAVDKCRNDFPDHSF